MKILVVGDGHSAIHEVAVVNAFKKLGHQVEAFYWQTYFNSPNPLVRLWQRVQNKFIIGPTLNRLNVDLINAVALFNPKLIFIYRGTHITHQTITEIKQKLPECVVHGYNNDDPFANGHPPWLCISIANRISLGVVAALHRDAPSQIDTFYLKFYNWGMLVSEFKVDRKQWMLTHTQLLPPSQRRDSITVSNTLNDTHHPFFGTGFTNTTTVTPASLVQDAASKVNPSAPAAFDRFTQSLTPTADEIAAQKNIESSTRLVDIVSHKPYETNLGISYAQVVGIPSAPFLFALGVKADGIYKFRENTWVNGMLNLRVADNFGKFNYDPPPTGLQPVRTNIRQYMTQSLATMPNLQVTNTGKLSNNQFVSAYAGYLELMFAGVGGEYLWRSTNSRLAIGADINRVRQRQFNVLKH